MDTTVALDSASNSGVNPGEVIITVLSAIIIAIVSSLATHLLSRKVKLEAEWRLNKLEQYRELLLYWNSHKKEKETK